MRSLGSLALVMVSATTSALLVVLSQPSTLSSGSPLVGLYEYQASAAQQGAFGLDATFLDWNDPQLVPRLRAFLRGAEARRRLPLLTLEPFPDRRAGRTNQDLLADVLAGRHDASLAAVARTLGAHPGPVLLRFGHEMDKVGLYPWSYRDSDRYIRLFHHVFARVAAERPSNVRWVWSPAGTRTADRYWPGDAYVDLIGLSIYTSRAWTPDRALEAFSLQLEQKRWLAQRYGLPLLVAEVGVSGSAADQQQWLGQALQRLPHYPELCGLVYFQAPQPRWMPLATGHEDWSLKPAALQWLQRQVPLLPRHGRACVEA